MPRSYLSNQSLVRAVTQFRVDILACRARIDDIAFVFPGINQTPVSVIRDRIRELATNGFLPRVPANLDPVARSSVARVRANLDSDRLRKLVELRAYVRADVMRRHHQASLYTTRRTQDSAHTLEAIVERRKWGCPSHAEYMERTLRIHNECGIPLPELRIPDTWEHDRLDPTREDVLKHTLPYARGTTTATREAPWCGWYPTARRGAAGVSAEQRPDTLNEHIDDMTPPRSGVSGGSPVASRAHTSTSKPRMLPARPCAVCGRERQIPRYTVSRVVCDYCISARRNLWKSDPGVNYSIVSSSPESVIYHRLKSTWSDLARVLGRDPPGFVRPCVGKPQSHSGS